MFQESDIIFSQFQELLLGADEEDGRCDSEEVIDMVPQYSELCTLFYYWFFMARTPTGWGANRDNSGRNDMMPPYDDAKVERSTPADEDAIDPWLGGSLDSFHGAMEWYQ
jgi:hypothetical protein